MILEACCQSVQSCLNAQKGGAWRVELCSALELGGLSPSSATIQLSRQYITLPIMVLVRPRPGDFVYDRIEIANIKREIENCKIMGIEGVVIGLLEEDGTVPYQYLKDLVNAAHPMEVTFHRAFDVCSDPFQAVETIIEAGCSRILTSGQKPKAIDGIDLIGDLNDNYGEQIDFMVGSGVNASNIKRFADIGIKEFHMSGNVKIDHGVKSDILDLTYTETDIQAIKDAKELIRSLRSGKE
ncbi:MAG: copper homeostasis protein [Litorivivens sp.]|jgi:copper homeostasis protein